MRRFHIALSVKNINDSVHEYNQRLEHEADIVIPGEYALWRTEILNFSIRQTNDPEKLRHFGWEDDAAAGFSKATDINGIVWEHFSEQQQREEINDLWPACVASQ